MIERPQSLLSDEQIGKAVPARSCASQSRGEQPILHSMQDYPQVLLCATMAIGSRGNTCSQIPYDPSGNAPIVNKPKKIALVQSAGRDQVGNVKRGKYAEALACRDRGPGKRDVSFTERPLASRIEYFGNI